MEDQPAKAPGLWRLLSPENWVTAILVLVVAGWSLFDGVLPEPVPAFSLAWGLSITVAAIATSLIFLQTRVARVERTMSTKTAFDSLSEKVDLLESGVRNYAERAEELARGGAPNQIDGPLIAERLRSLLESPGATTWKFRGGSGRWQRETVLPTLAKVTDRDLVYKMLILDPREDHLCLAYAKYRNTHRKDEPSEDVHSIRMQLAACVVAAVWASLISRVKPEIRLGQVYSPMRLDLGTHGLMLTVSDPALPGLLASSESWLYRALDDEFERSAERAPQVIFDTEMLNAFEAGPVPDDQVAAAILSSAMVQESNLSTKRLFTDEQIEALDVPAIAKSSWPPASASPKP